MQSPPEELSGVTTASGVMDPADVAALVAEVRELRRRVESMEGRSLPAGEERSERAEMRRFKRQQILENQPERFRGFESRVSPAEWADGMHVFFERLERNDTPFSERDKVEHLTMRLAGSADDWWRALDTGTRLNVTTEAEFMALLEGNFQILSRKEQAEKELDGLRQGGRTLQDYLAHFRKVVAQLPDMSDSDKARRLKAGMNAQTGELVMRHQPRTYDELIKACMTVVSWGMSTGMAHHTAPQRRSGGMPRGYGYGRGPEPGGGRSSSYQRPPAEDRSQQASATRARGPDQGSVRSEGARLCHICHAPGHFARNCPNRSGDAPPQARPSGMIAAVSERAEGCVPVCGGGVAGIPARVMFDTGADINVVSQTWLEKHGLRTADAPERRMRGVSGESWTLDKALTDAPIQLGAYRGEVTLYEIPMHAGEYDVILGMPWLKERDCTISTGQQTVTLLHGRERIEIACGQGHVAVDAGAHAVAPMPCLPPRARRPAPRGRAHRRGSPRVGCRR